MTTKKTIDIDEEDIFSDESSYDDLDLLEELEVVEEEEEDQNMGHRVITSNPEMDGDGDYFFNEKYYEQ